MPVDSARLRAHPFTTTLLKGIARTMNKKLISLATLVVLVGITFVASCTRIETGEVGLRVGFDKQISPTELCSPSP
jgi:hypothetical protein